MSVVSNQLQHNLQLLKDADKQQRLKAIATLENISDRNVAQALVVTVKDKDIEVRNSALKALYKLNDHWLIDIIVGGIEQTQDYEYASYLATVLTSLAQKVGSALPHIIDMLNHENDLVRIQTAKILGVIGSKEAVKPLLKTLNDNNYEVRFFSAKSLGQLEDKQAIEPLIKALNDQAVEVRTHAANSLHQLGAVEAIPRFIEILKEIDQLGLENLDNSQISLRINVAEALASFGKPAIRPLLAVIEHGESPSIELALHYVRKESATEALLEAIPTGNSEVRLYALRTLKQIGFDERAVYPLIQILDDPDESVRYRAAFGLYDIGHKYEGDEENNPIKPAIEPLIKLLADPDNEIRYAVLAALGQVANKNLINIFLDALEDDDPDVKASAIKTLGYIGNKIAVPYLTQIQHSDSNLTSNNKSIADLATEALSSIELRAAKMTEL